MEVPKKTNETENQDMQKFKCHNCDKEFDQQYDLELHVTLFHTIEEQKNKSEICEKVLSTPALLKSHVNKIHKRKRKQYRRDPCSNLKKHIPANVVAKCLIDQVL